MKRTVTKSDFASEFHKTGRGNHFTKRGLCELYDFLIKTEDYTGEEIELDVIALCCDFGEDHYIDLVARMDIDTGHFDDEDDLFQAVLDELNDSTMVVYADYDNGMIMYANH